MKPATPRVAAAEPAGEELRAQELLLSLMATGRLPADIVSVEDFQDPLLKNLYDGLQRGESPASLVEQETDQVTRARVSHLLFTPPSEDTNQLIRMAQDCVATMRLNPHGKPRPAGHANHQRIFPATPKRPPWMK